MSRELFDTIVIGAGLSGLMAATMLQAEGQRVLVLDKGRGLGGRLATRRIGEAVFDHGAQYFTARHPAFLPYVERWAAAHGIIRPWFNKPPSGDTAWIGTQGMTTIAKALGRPLNVKLSCQVSRVEATDNRIDVFTADGLIANGKRLLMTAPYPQAAAMLASCMPTVSHDSSMPSYKPSLTLLLTLPHDTRPPGPEGWVMPEDNAIGWIADNHAKGISPCPAWTVQATPDWSQTHFDDPDEAVIEMLLAALTPWLTKQPTDIQLKRWRYALAAERNLPQPYQLLETKLPIILAGDGYKNGRVEAAALSGIEAAKKLLTL